MEFSNPSSSSSGPPSRKLSDRRLSREKFLFRELLPAIRGRSCPICLGSLRDGHGAAVVTKCLHAYCLSCIRRWSDLKRRCPLCNAEFDSLFSGVSIRYRSFREEKLPAHRSDEEDSRNAPTGSSYLGNRRVIRRSRDCFNSSSSCRTRPLQWRRSFGRPGSVPPNVVAERKLQWRASIYSQGLQAVRPSPARRPEQNVSRSNDWKQRLLQRIEPWIKRELQTILGDPDPSVTVHVATSLFIQSFEQKIDPSRQLDDNNLTTPLYPFLHNWTNMFWHELRCYAESSLAMETYDAVVEYKRLE